MRILSFLLFLLSYAYAQDINSDKAKDFVLAKLNAEKWNCAKVVNVERMAPDHYGYVYRVTCNVLDDQKKQSSVQYRYTQTVDDNIRIEPWR